MNIIRGIILLLILALLSACHGHRKGGGRGGDRQKDSSSESFIERLDKDGDSKVSMEEFDGPDEHFHEADKNADGYITEDEVPSRPPRRGA